MDTGATFTKVPRSILEDLDIPAARTYTALLADGRRVPREQGWATIRLEGQQFPTPVAFGEEGEPTLLGAMALEHALLAVDPHGQRLMPSGCPGDDQHERMNVGKLQHPLKRRATACKDDADRPSTWPAWPRWNWRLREKLRRQSGGTGQDDERCRSFRTETTMRQGRWKTAAMVSWHVGKEAAGGALQWRGRGVESDA